MRKHEVVKLAVDFDAFETSGSVYSATHRCTFSTDTVKTPNDEYQRAAATSVPSHTDGCDAMWTVSWFLSQRKEQPVMGKIFWPKRDGEIGDWRNLRVGELCVLYTSPNVTEAIKCRKTGNAGHEACVHFSRKT